MVCKSSLPGAGGRGWATQSGPQGPGGKCAIRCSICSPTRLRGSRGHFWASPDEKGSIFDHLGVLLVPKMAFLRSETQFIRFKFGSDGLKMMQVQGNFHFVKVRARTRRCFFSRGRRPRAQPFRIRRPRGTRVVACGSTRNHMLEGRR